MINMYEVSLFKPVYYTAGYNIHHAFSRNCQGAGKCNYKECKMNKQSFTVRINVQNS